jgi:2-keto-4-pentenoate hydratase/2-oxohepta-3-ene-1,7-dioic acid hydratase in catechol pathway
MAERASGTSAHGAPDGASGSRALARGLTLLHAVRDGAPRLAAKTAGGILDVAEAARLLGLPAPGTIDEMLQREEGASVNAVVEAALGGSAARSAFLGEAGLRYGPVVTRPEKILCVGLNYRRHAEEIGAPIPKVPVLFSKFNNALNHHEGTIALPREVASRFDYEVELVVVMGRTARDVSEADALSHVAGYCTGNDFSARDLQFDTGGQWLAGKTSDGFAPLGPYLVTADQVDPDHLAIECRVNGETRQSSSTSDFIFGTRRLVSYASRIFTLRPGDVIFTGTPQGVIQGRPAEGRVWLGPGDRIACSVEKLGELRFSLT